MSIKNTTYIQKTEDLLNTHDDWNNRLYRGIDLSVKFKDEIATQSGSTDEQKRWQWMKARIKAQDWTGLHVGDYLKLKATSYKDTDGTNAGADAVEEHEMQIAGIDTFYNTGGAETHGENSCAGLAPIPHHIDFISRNVLSNTVMWNTAAVNSGTGSGADDATDQPFLTSHVYTYLQKVLGSIDETVQGLIAPKVNLLERRARNTSTALTNSTGWHWYNMGKLWLPTEYEVFGSVVWGTPQWSASQAMQYPLFASNWLNTLKLIGPNPVSTARSAWWLACAGGGSSTDVCIVTHSGDASCNSATDTNIRVPLCFRITAA